MVIFKLITTHMARIDNGLNACICSSGNIFYEKYCSSTSQLNTGLASFLLLLIHQFVFSFERLLDNLSPFHLSIQI